MQISFGRIAVALIHIAAFTSATPFVLSSMISNPQLRAIAPLTVAGTIFAHRAFATANLEPRRGTDTVRWNAPGSQTYVILTMTSALPAEVVLPMFNVAQAFVQQALLSVGDGVITTGRVDYHASYMMTFRTWNTNNHQQTYGVVGAAIAALRNYMSIHGYGSATFNIFDGPNEVGAGVIGPVGLY